MSSCIPDFDNQLTVNDLKQNYPELEIIDIYSYPCDGTFGDCYYVDVTLKKDPLSNPVDTSFQYNRMCHPDSTLVINYSSSGRTTKIIDK